MLGLTEQLFNTGHYRNSICTDRIPTNGVKALKEGGYQYHAKAKLCWISKPDFYRGMPFLLLKYAQKDKNRLRNTVKNSQTKNRVKHILLIFRVISDNKFGQSENFSTVKTKLVTIMPAENCSKKLNSSSIKCCAHDMR